MSPYWAIVKDSFLDAARSKVLWILLVGWTVCLGLLAPLGFIEEQSVRFISSDILESSKLQEQLKSATQGRGSLAQKRVAEVLSEDTKKKLKSQDEDLRGFARAGQLLDALNETLDKADLYEPTAFPKAKRRGELSSLIEIETSKLKPDELAERNRRLVEMAFPGFLRAVNPNRIAYGYAGIKLGEDIPLTKRQLQGATMLVIFAVMKLGVGIVAMLVAVIITSWMIPEMFQGGSLHLLLSKPLSRSLLFLSKFAGGCIFVTFNIIFVLGGLYLIAGFRFDIWNVGILWCIPVFMLIFVIFYSVSALAGVVWKNAIVCIVVTALFWAACFVLGTANDILQGVVREQPKLSLIHQAHDQLFATTGQGEMKVWDSKGQLWQSAYGVRGGPTQVAGIFSISDVKELYLAKGSGNPFGGFRDLEMLIIDLSSNNQANVSTDSENNNKSDVRSDERSDERADANAESKTKTAAETENSSKDIAKVNATPKETVEPMWSSTRLTSGPSFPQTARRVKAFGKNLYVLSESGLFEFVRDAVVTKKKSPNVIIGWMESVLPTAGEAFSRISPEEWQTPSPMDFAMNDDQTECVVLYEGKLQKLTCDTSGQFNLIQSPVTVSEDAELTGRVAIKSDRVLVSIEKSVPQYFNLADLSPAGKLESVGEIAPKTLLPMFDSDGFALLTTEGELWTMDATNDWKPTHLELTGQSQVRAIAVQPNNQIIVAHTTNSADLWSLPMKSSEALVRPKRRTVDFVFDYIIHPLYLVNPKPAALDNVTLKALEKGSGQAMSGIPADIDVDAWTPVWTNLIFVGVMLTISCVVLYRQDL